MTLPVVLRREASRDVEAARDYYDGLRPGRGQDFLIRLAEVLNRIAAMPEMYALVWQDVRATRLRKFSYVAYYRVLPDRIECWRSCTAAVMHPHGKAALNRQCSAGAGRRTTPSA